MITSAPSCRLRINSSSSLPRPDERARVELLAALHDGVEDYDARRAGKLAKLVERLVGGGDAVGRNAHKYGAVALVARAADVARARHLFFKRVYKLEEIRIQLARHARVEKFPHRGRGGFGRLVVIRLRSRLRPGAAPFAGSRCAARTGPGSPSSRTSIEAIKSSRNKARSVRSSCVKPFAGQMRVQATQPAKALGAHARRASDRAARCCARCPRRRARRSPRG